MNNKIKKLLVCLCSSVMALSLVACSGTNDSSSDKNTVTLAKELDVISMDSSYATDGSSIEAIQTTIDGLLTVDADGNLIPVLAKEKAKVSEDGLTYTYELRDAKWDNGKTVTANDFVYAWQRTVSNADSVKVDKLVFNVVKDLSSSALAFESGDVQFTKLNKDLVDKYKDSDEYSEVLEGYLWYFQYNFGNEYLANENIRKAISLAIDKEDLVNNVLKDGSIVAKGFVPTALATGPDGKDYRETAPSYMNTNIDEAKKCWEAGLKELGVDSISLNMLFDNADPAKSAAEYLQSHLQSTLDGLTIEMVAQEKNNRIEMQKSRDFDISLTRWGPDYADPTTYLYLMTTGNSYNYGDYTNKEYDNKINEAADAKDAETRWELLKAAEGICMDDYAVAPIFQVGGASLVNKNVKGIETHAVGVSYIYKNVEIVK